MTNPGHADETPPPEEQATPWQTGADAATPEAAAGGDPDSPAGQPVEQPPAPPWSSEVGGGPAYEHPPAYPPSAPSPGFAPLDYPGGAPDPYPPAGYPPPTGGDAGAQYPGAGYAGPQYPGAQYPGAPYPPGQPGFAAPPYGAAQYGPPPGYPDPNYYGYTARPSTNMLAIWSLVVALVGLPFLLTGFLAFVTVPTSIAGIVLGMLAVNQIKTTGENGRGLAIGGIAAGSALLIVIVLGIVLLVALASVANAAI